MFSFLTVILYFSDYNNPSKDFDEEVKDYISQGFKAIKMKVGLGIKEDFKNVKRMREVIGEDIELMIDSNHAYTLREAVTLAKKLEPFDISWFEEPLSPELPLQYRQLSDKLDLPLASHISFLRVNLVNQSF